MSDILDYRLQHVLQDMIYDLPYKDRYQLRNIFSCGRRITISNTQLGERVYLTKDIDDNVNFVGQSHCKNPFCCPVCSAKIMEEYRSKIGSALDMLRDKFFGFMVTFTIPHLKFMSCRETTDILYDTWKYFHQKNFTKNVHYYQEFSKAVGIKHWVRVCEYTYGVNGWHPHFHCIFWCERKNKDKILEFEDKLNEFWTKQAKRVTLKYWKENKLHNEENLEDLTDRLFAFRTDKGLFISKKDGKVLESLSADYLAGWGSDSELTGNIRKKASHEGHMTPYQVLQQSEYNSEYKKIYLDFCLSVTRKPVHHRLNFSKTGILKAIQQYRQIEGYRSVIDQKKRMARVVTFFDSSEWSNLCNLNKEFPVLSNILYLTKYDEYLLADYLESVKIKIRRREEYEEIFEIAEAVLNGEKYKISKCCEGFQQLGHAG